MLIKQKAYNNILKKTILLVVTAAFMVNDLAFALPENPRQDTSTLAVPCQLTEEAFRDRFASGEFLLTYGSAAKYVSRQMEREKGICRESKTDWENERTRIIHPGVDGAAFRGLIMRDVPGLKAVRCVKLTGVMAHTGQFGIVDLTGEFTGYTDMPTMVVDSSFYDVFDNELIRHELDEILQWEYLRAVILKISDEKKRDMAGWIESAYDGIDEKSKDLLRNTPYKNCRTSQDIARMIHTSSFPLKELYAYKIKQLGEIGVKAAFNFEVISALYRYGVSKPSRRVNISASVPAETAVADGSPMAPQTSNITVWDIITGQSEKITREELLRRFREGGLTEVIVEDTINERGIASLGRYAVVHQSKLQAGKKIRYLMHDNVVVTKSVGDTEGRASLEARSFSIVRDKAGRVIESFVQNHTIPPKIRRLVNAGVVGRIERLLVPEEGLLSFSADMTYDFRSQGDLKGVQVAVYFNGGPGPDYFLVDKGNGESLRIRPEDIMVREETPEEIIYSHPEGADDSDFIVDQIQPPPDIYPMELEHIRDALAEAIAGMPAGMRNLAQRVLEHILDFKDSGDQTREKRLAEYLGVSEKDVIGVLTRLSVSDALRIPASVYIQKWKGSGSRARAPKKSRLSVSPDTMPPPGYVVMRDMASDTMELIARAEFCERYRKNSLGHVEIIGDRLDPAGKLFVYLGRSGKKPMSQWVCGFSGYGGRLVRYIIKDGRIDRASVIIHDEKGRAMIDKKIRYAADIDSGEVKCHLPEKLHRSIMSHLDNVDIFNDELSSSGALRFGGNGKGGSRDVCKFKKHGHRKVRYQVFGGRAKMTSVILLDDKGKPLDDKKTRYAVDNKTGAVICHIPDRSEDRFFRHLDDVTIVNDRLTAHGAFMLGSSTHERRDYICQFINYPRARMLYRISMGKVDRTSVILLDQGSQPITDGSIRYAVDVSTGKLKCHLPETISPEVIKKLGGVIVYDRLNGRGSLYFLGRVCEFGRHPNRRVRYEVDGSGRPVRSTITLLAEDGGPLIDKDTRFVRDIKTGKIRCHLPDGIPSELAKELVDVVIVDRTYNNGMLHKISGTAGKSTVVATIIEHRNGRVSYAMRKDGPDLTSLILLDDRCDPIVGKETAYAIDIKTGDIKCYVPSRVPGSWLEDLGAVEIVNRYLSESGELFFGGKCIYRNSSYKNKRARFILNKGKLVSIVIMDDTERVICEEVADEGAAKSLLSAQYDIPFIGSPGGRRYVSYNSVVDGLYNAYIDSIGKGADADIVRKVLRKRIYELLNPNVYFMSGTQFSRQAQNRFKSELFALWEKAARPDCKDLPEAIKSATWHLAAVSDAIGEEPRCVADIPAEFMRQAEADYAGSVVGEARHASLKTGAAVASRRPMTLAEQFRRDDEHPLLGGLDRTVAANGSAAVDELEELSPRDLRTLKFRKIATIDDLTKRWPELLATRNFGMKSFREVLFAAENAGTNLTLSTAGIVKKEEEDSYCGHVESLLLRRDLRWPIRRYAAIVRSVMRHYGAATVKELLDIPVSALIERGMNKSRLMYIIGILKELEKWRIGPSAIRCAAQKTPVVLRKGEKTIAISVGITKKLADMLKLARGLDVELHGTIYAVGGIAISMDCPQDESRIAIIRSRNSDEAAVTENVEYFDAAIRAIRWIKRFMREKEKAIGAGSEPAELAAIDEKITNSVATLRGALDMSEISLFSVKDRRRYSLSVKDLDDIERISADISNVDYAATKWIGSCDLRNEIPQPYIGEGVDVISVHNHPNGNPSPPSAIDEEKRLGDIYHPGFFRGRITANILDTEDGDEIFFFYETDDSQKHRYLELYDLYWYVHGRRSADPKEAATTWDRGSQTYNRSVNEEKVLDGLRTLAMSPVSGRFMLTARNNKIPSRSTQSLKRVKAHEIQPDTARTQNTPGREDTRALLDGTLAESLDAGEAYVIRYDERRLLEAGLGDGLSALEAVEAYVMALKTRSAMGIDPDKQIVLKKADGSRAKDAFLISIERYSDVNRSSLLGKSFVDVKGDLKGVALDIESLFTMQLAACQIPVATPVEKLSDYSIMSTIERCYAALTGETFNPAKGIARIVLSLPSAARISAEALREYYRNTIERLKSYA